VTPPPRYQDARSQTSVAQSLPPAAEMGIAGGAIDGSGKGADSRIQSLFPPPERTEAKSFGAPTPKPATPLTHRSASEGMAGQDLSSGRDQDRWPALPKNSSQMLEMAPGAAAPPRPAPQKRQFDPKVLDPAAPEGGAVVALVVYRNEGDSEPSALLRAQNDVEKALKKLNGDMKSSMLQTLADGHSVRETRIAIDPDKASQLIKELSNRGYKYNKSADGRPFSKVLDQTADALSKAQKAPKSGGALFIVHPLPKTASTQKKATAKSLAPPDLGSKGFAGPSTTPADMWIRIVCLP
jgi:hypothetical protein